MQIARGVVNFPSKNSSNLRLILFKSQTVFTEITNVVQGSNIQSRGKSYAASVPCDVPKIQKGRKRVSKDQRKAMVESFVNKYRSMNAGKFPAASDAQKQVGGNYYIVRQILQELEYNSKIPPLQQSSKNIFTKKLTEENEPLAEIEEASVSQMTMKRSQKTGSLSDFVAKERLLQKGQPKKVSHQLLERLEDGKEEEFAAEGLTHVPPQDQGALKPDSAIDESRKQTNDEVLQKKSTLWGNLKSLADDFINMWKKP